MLAIVNATAARTSTGSVAVNVTVDPVVWVTTLDASPLRAVSASFWTVVVSEDLLMQVSAEGDWPVSAEAHAFASGSCLR